MIVKSGADIKGVSSRMLALLMCTAAASTLILPTSAALSQTIAKDTDNSATIETVLVTAEKRVENVQNVPIAIDAVQGDQLMDKGINAADDIVKSFPNISVQGISAINDGVTIRGVGTANFHLNAQESVGQYFDEVSAPTPFTSQLGLFDLQRIEVLRGPQNTLFGRNTTGGAINYISRLPDVDAGLNGYGRITVGNYAQVNFEGAVGIPLSDTVAVRAAVMTQNRDGVFTNLDNGQKYDSISRWGGRLALEWKPSEATTVYLSGHVASSTGAPAPTRAVGLTLSDGVTPCPALTTGTNAYIGLNNCYAQTKTGTLVNVSTKNWNDVYGTAPPVGDVKDAGGALNIAHDFGGVKLTAITGIDHTSVRYANEASGTPYLQFNVNQDGTYDLYSQEIRLQSTNGGPFNWIVGGYYSYEDDDLGTLVINNSGNPVAPPLVLTTELKQTDNLGSVYASGSYDITQRLTASAGLRVSFDNRTGTIIPRVFDYTQDGTALTPQLSNNVFLDLAMARSLVANVTTPCDVGVRLCNGPGHNERQNTQKVGWNASLKYQFTANIMGYASYSRGFKAGAFDVRALAVFLGSANVPVKPETLDAYEVGLKSTLMDGHLRLNGDIFHYDWHDLQAFSATTSGGPAFLNVPLSKIDGAELDAALRLEGGWSFDANAGYLDGRITDSGGLPGVGNGAPLANVPKWTFNGTLGKDFEIGNSLFNLGMTYRFQGSENSSLNGDPGSRISQASYLDLSAGYTFGDTSQYRLVALAQNVTSTKTCMSNLYTFQAGTYECIPNEGVPLYSVSLQWTF
ncbi:MAG: TonB-dependent receptor [Alphaproteobacteria bacterium]|nr:TonB-dependent receptor [Alphaproteobacteria bacterium]MDE2073521.1 TonB-dependent receptor [Alphaproteobacteria bacterium]